MRNRSSVIIIENKKVLLMKRVKEGRMYYVFPGGGIEIGETPEEAAKREAFEELGVEVKIIKCISKVAFNGTQYYYLADIVSGKVGTGNGNEFRKTDRGTYTPMFISVSDLPAVNVIPKQVIQDFLPFA